MARSEFPIGSIMPVSMIQRIREEQEWYDRDPERAERIYRQREEDRQMEIEEERQEERRRRNEE